MIFLAWLKLFLRCEWYCSRDCIKYFKWALHPAPAFSCFAALPAFSLRRSASRFLRTRDLETLKGVNKILSPQDSLKSETIIACISFLNWDLGASSISLSWELPPNNMILFFPPTWSTSLTYHPVPLSLSASPRLRVCVLGGLGRCRYPHAQAARLSQEASYSKVAEIIKSKGNSVCLDYFPYLMQEGFIHLMIWDSKVTRNACRLLG